MIVPMRKLTLFCMASTREQTLDRLRALGVVHLKSIQPPGGGDLEQARRRLQQVRGALESLPAEPAVKQVPDLEPDRAVEEIIRLRKEEEDLAEERDALVQERARVAPFGSFDPDSLRALAEQGIVVRLYHASAREKLQPPPGTVLQRLHEGKDGVYFALVGRDKKALDGFTRAQAVRPPEQSLDAMDQRLKALDEQRRERRADRARLAGLRTKVTRLLSEAEDQVAFLEARAGMGEAEGIGYLAGYLPAEAEPLLQEAARRHGWGYRVTEPPADELPPTLVRPPRWAQPIRPVLEMINLVPGYRETDISAVFLVFFCLFYGMLVGDAGYGLLFLGAMAWARRRVPNAPRPLFVLWALTSAATILWGILTGVWFGTDFLPPVVPWLTLDHRNMMALCFGIGSLHIALAHLWRAWQQRRSFRALAQIGWTGSTACMFFVALNLVVGVDLPRFVLWGLGGSVALIALFMTAWPALRKQWIDHAMLPLTVINNFVDVVSYVRLFAVGLATLAVAQAFNDMAVGGGLGGLLSGLIAVAILLIGHSLNIVMALIGVMVHGLRLNALEFSGHMGVEWSGYAYRPFRRAEHAGAVDSQEETTRT